MPRYSQLEATAEAEIARLTRQLQPEVRAALDDLPVHLQARPDEAIAEEFGDDLLGLFSGEALEERGETLCPSPPQIHLYLKNLWEASEHDPEIYRAEVGITFLHELGHYLGWDEEDLDRHGIG